MQNGNRFKLGLFGMNCSGSVGTTAPERWNAGWPENREAARLADAAGIEFLLPIARWLGYGGWTDRHGTSFETLSWASALLAATKEIVAFATVHALPPFFRQRTKPERPQVVLAKTRDTSFRQAFEPSVALKPFTTGFQHFA